MTLFERIKLLANKQGKSINKVEEDLSLSRNSLYSWKKVTPAYERLSLVANYFGVSTDYLMNGETPEGNDETIDTTTFDRIKELAEKKGKSLPTVSAELKFSDNLFYRWKTSKPKAEDLAKVADYFNVSVDYLLGREELKGEVLDDTKEQDLLAAFRLESKNMSDEGKEKFNESLKDMMKLASKYLNDDKYWKE